jgi:hypothetical protein
MSSFSGSSDTTAVKEVLDQIKEKTDNIPNDPAKDRATATDPSATRLSDGTSFYKATTPTDNQQVVLYDSLGTKIETIETVDGYITISTNIIQNVVTAALNSSTENLGPGATFTGQAENTYGVAGIQVNIFCDQPVRIYVEQSIDSVNWDIEDKYDRAANVGDGRTIQAVGAWFRVVILNLGPIATTKFRLMSVLCPIVEAVPRTTTPAGALRLSKSFTSYAPSHDLFSNTEYLPALSQDVRNQLMTRSSVFTDEKSFRDDFTEGGKYVDLTGVCYFNEELDHVAGLGTKFLTEVNLACYIKLSTDDDAYLVGIKDVLSDTDLILESNYSSTGSGTGQISLWNYDIETGGGISISSSEMIIDSGTTSGSITQAYRYGDYLPFVFESTVKISQRITNQEIFVGLADNDYNLADKQALILFSGTDATKVKLYTSFSNTHIKITEVTLPYEAVTSDYNTYKIDINNSQVTMIINDIKMIIHHIHIPGPYDVMDIFMGIKNTGVPGGNTLLTLDHISFSNFNRIEIALSAQGDPIVTKNAIASVATDNCVSAAKTDTILLAHNINRFGATVYNYSTANMYLKLGTGASPTCFTALLRSGDYYETPFNYTGQIDGYWTSATGTAHITEVI